MTIRRLVIAVVFWTMLLAISVIVSSAANVSLALALYISVAGLLVFGLLMCFTVAAVMEIENWWQKRA